MGLYQPCNIRSGIFARIMWQRRTGLRLKTSCVAKVEMAVWYRICCKHVAVLVIKIQSVRSYALSMNPFVQHGNVVMTSYLCETVLMHCKCIAFPILFCKVFNLCWNCGTSFSSCSNSNNIMAGFKVAGISPFDRYIFQEDEFATAFTKNHPM